MKPLISVIMPTKDHPVEAVSCIHKLFSSTQDFNIECIVVAYPDKKSQKVFEDLDTNHNITVIWDTCGRIPAWNMGAAIAKGDYIHGSSDDFDYQSGWLNNVMDYMSDLSSDSYVKINSNPSHKNPSKVWWAEIGIGHRDFFKNHLGGVLVVPHYKAIFTDLEISERAKNAGVFHVSDSFIKHDWNGPAPGHLQIHDQRMYQQRKSQGFPSNYDPVII